MTNLVALFLRTSIIYIALCAGCFLMLRIILGYASFELDVQFLRFKQDYIHNEVWLAAFYIHVFTAIIALFAGFTQFSDFMMREHRRLHRLFGKIYVYDILFINVPVGLILAINANGLLLGRTAFVLLDLLWFLFTYKALICAQQRNFIHHKRYVTYSYALTLSAITLRAWQLILSSYFSLDPSHLYIMEAWLGFVPNLIVANWIIRTRERKPIVEIQPARPDTERRS